MTDRPANIYRQCLLFFLHVHFIWFVFVQYMYIIYLYFIKVCKNNLISVAVAHKSIEKLWLSLNKWTFVEVS